LIVLWHVVLVALFFAFCDNTIGMGYGTLLTAVLITFGFSPIVAVPAVILSGLVNGLFVSYSHHYVGNVDFGFDGRSIRIALMFASLSLVGILVSAYLAVSLAESIVVEYISLMVILMGGFDAVQGAL